MKKLLSALMVLGLMFLTACKSSSPAGLFVGQSHFAQFGTNKVHYVTVGRGRQTIVFVHGWGGNADVWRYQIPSLADKARLILVDLPGHGKSDKPHTNYTPDFFASAVLAVMTDANVKRAVLVGHSMGAPVICSVYKQAPEKVAALVSVDGTLRKPHLPRERTEAPPRLRSAQAVAELFADDPAEKFIGRFRGPDYQDQVREFIGSMMPIHGTESIRDGVVSTILQTPQYVLVSAMEGMFQAGGPDWDVQHAKVPILVINARNPMWTPEYQTYVRSLSSRSDYRVIENTGHFIQLEEPVAFNLTLIEMLHEFGLLAK